MYYIYILLNKINGQIYTGSTNDLRRRVQEHNDGREISTKRYRPWILYYYEAYSTESLARLREKRLKNNGNTIRELKKRIEIPVKSGAGFTIIETAIALLLVIVTITIFGVALSSLPLTRTARNQNIAYHIAAKKIEEFRNTQFASLPPNSSFADPGLANLNNASANFTLEDYGGSSQIKIATVRVQWQEESRTRDVVLETLISDRGLNRP